LFSPFQLSPFQSVFQFVDHNLQAFSENSVPGFRFFAISKDFNAISAFPSLFDPPVRELDDISFLASFVQQHVLVQIPVLWSRCLWHFLRRPPIEFDFSLSLSGMLTVPNFRSCDARFFFPHAFLVIFSNKPGTMVVFFVVSFFYLFGGPHCGTFVPPPIPQALFLIFASEAEALLVSYLGSFFFFLYPPLYS